MFTRKFKKPLSSAFLYNRIGGGNRQGYIIITIIILIIMKNFNRRSSHGHHGSKAPRTGATRTHVDRTHSLIRHTYTYQHNRVMRKRQLSYYTIWNRIFTLKVGPPEVHIGYKSSPSLIIVIFGTCQGRSFPIVQPSRGRTEMYNFLPKGRRTIDHRLDTT